MKSLKATLAVILVTLVSFSVIYWLTKSMSGDAVSLPRSITAGSVCPVAGCSAKVCHGAAPAPKLAPGQTMKCPKVGCEAATCHAQGRLTSHYNTPKRASLNVWVMGLSLFTMAMILIALYI